jgi:glycine/D-amino acid oxidase-like deaminating enzyme/nitrite reductase/ring-hydroxylating ferredoxin subunit
MTYPAPSGETSSLWYDTVEVPSYPPLARDATVDVCVVGAGIAGLSAAYMLAKAGKKVMVIDDGPIGGGESGRTTAHLTYVMDDRFYVLEHIHGNDGLRRIVESHATAVSMIESIVRAEQIDCDFRRVDGFLFLGEGDKLSILEEELAAAHRAGISDVSLMPSMPGVARDVGPCLRFPNQGQFHILKYLTGVAAAIVKAGGSICCGTKAESVEGGDPCTVKTKPKHTITANAVCVCTNGSISDMTKTHLKQAPYRTFVIAAVVPAGSAPALFWDTGSPYHYIRTQPLSTPLGDARAGGVFDALIVGGEDHKTGHADDAVERWARLETWMRERWPEAREVINRWSGQVLEPNDYIAFIGRNPDGAQNVYMASGDSGQGMTHGTIAGMLLSDLVLGRSNPWETLYDPKRVSLRARPVAEFLHENADVALQWVRGFLGGSEKPSDAEIPRDSGAVMRHGKHLVATYRDRDGKLHERSALCTHLKCPVAWNSAERSWDCPCHGSRFDPYGKVLNGPAVTDLEKVPE